MNILIMIMYIISTTSGLVLVKFGSTVGMPISILGSGIKYNINIWTLIGISLYGISFLLYIYLISKYNLGYIIPLLSAFVYILIFAASFLIFKESFTFIKIIAISMIMIGVILLNIQK